jgi:hypothetical protein
LLPVTLLFSSHTQHRNIATTTAAAAGALLSIPRIVKFPCKNSKLSVYLEPLYEAYRYIMTRFICVCERERERERERDPSQVLPQTHMWAYIALCEYWKSASRFVDFCKPETVRERERERDPSVFVTIWTTAWPCDQT